MGMGFGWNGIVKAPVVRRAAHALLYIQDGKYQSQLNLKGSELAGSNVRYWPETGHVRFRLELFDGSQTASDELHLDTAADARRAERAVVERARPSPFSPARVRVVRAESARVEVRRPAPEPAMMPNAVPAAVPAPAKVTKESGLSRVVGKIPLLRRLKKHSQGVDSGTVE
jgi:hypothetical protein